MKKILFTLITALALITTVCSTTNKASAAEEQGEVTPTSSNVYSDNQFTGININFENEYEYPSYFTNENPSYSKLIPFKEDKGIIISLKYKLDYELNSNMPHEVSGNAILFGENFTIIATKPLKNFASFNYEYDTSSKCFSYTGYISSNVQSRGEYTEKSRYISIELNNISYFDTTGVLHGNEVVTPTDVYIGYEIDEHITTLKDLEFDYTVKEDLIVWNSTLGNIDSKYLEFDVSKDMLTNPSKYFSAVNTNGEKLVIKSGHMNAYSFIIEVGQSYYYIIEARDSVGNKDHLFVKFNVKDVEAPIISGPTQLRVPNKLLQTISSIKNSLIITDNYDSTDQIKLVVKYDYYTDNYYIPGEYFICFTATDTAGNSTDFTIKIIVEDKDVPVFYDTNGQRKTDETVVLKSIDSVLLLSDFLNQLKAVDSVDGDLTIKVFNDEYTGNGDKVGVYQLKLSATDSSGNVAFHSVKINVIDSMPSKTIFIDNKIVIVEKTVKLSSTDFHNMLKLSGKYSTETTSYTKIYDYIYNPSFDLPGEYLVPYDITTTSGIEENGTLIVKVVDGRNGSLVDHPEENNDGFIVSILKWIWNLIVSIYEWFIGLFK